MQFIQYMVVTLHRQEICAKYTKNVLNITLKKMKITGKEDPKISLIIKI